MSGGADVNERAERLAFEWFASSQIGKNLTRRDNWYSNEMPQTREEIAAAAFRAGYFAALRVPRGEQ